MLLTMKKSRIGDVTPVLELVMRSHVEVNTITTEGFISRVINQFLFTLAIPIRCIQVKQFLVDGRYGFTFGVQVNSGDLLARVEGHWSS